MSHQRARPADEPCRVIGIATADEEFMKVALEAAERSLAAGEPPVGACVVQADEVVAAAGNAVISELDITAHGEIRALREACRTTRSLSLEGATLYVTVEPCAMCATAIRYAGINRVVTGAPISVLADRTGWEQPGDLSGDIEHVAGVLGAECEALVEQWRPLR